MAHRNIAAWLAVGVIACAGLASSAAAQNQFQRIIGTDGADLFHDIRATSDQGSIAVGHFDLGGSFDVVVMKTAPDGSPVWVRLLSTPVDETAYSVAEVIDGYVIAAEANNPVNALQSLAVAKLDFAGGLKWAYVYSGAYLADPIHQENAGPIVRRVDEQLEPIETSITHRALGGTWPTLLLLDNMGNPLLHNAYLPISPTDPDTALLSFTDHRYDPRSAEFRVTGTLQLTGVQGTPQINHVAYVVIDGAGAVKLANAYNFFPSPLGEPGSPVDSWGHAIELDDALGVAIAGDSTLAVPIFGPGAAAVFGMRLDGLGMALAVQTALDPQRPMSVGFSALSEEDNPFAFVLAGRVQNPPMGMTIAFDRGMLLPMWSHLYGPVGPTIDDPRLDAIDNNPRCGLWAAGRVNMEPYAPFFGGPDAWWLGTRNGGPETGCFENPFIPLFEPNDTVPLPFEMVQEPIASRDVWPVELIDLPPTDVILCDKPCCAADLAPPFGVLDFFDVLEFLNRFSAMDPRADLAPPFGAWDFFDVLQYLNDFSAGC